MTIPLLTKWISRRRRSRIRAMMRGYRALKQRNQLGWVRRAKRELAATRFDEIASSGSIHFFGAAAESAALSVQQYVLTRVGGGNLNRALLYSLGSKTAPVSHPLPKEYQRVLVRNGFRVSHWRCSVLWAGYVGLIWCYGLFSITKHLYDAVLHTRRPQPVVSEPYAYFAALSSNNLPQPCIDGRSHDILTWYANWQGASAVSLLMHGVAGATTTYVHGKRVACSEHMIPPLKRIRQLIGFLQWATVAILVSAIEGLRGRWWYALVLVESAKAAIVHFANPDQLAREYLFHFSDTIYRPLWTYEAEKKGSQISCYFYSTSEEYKLPTGYEPNSTYWSLMNWPRYLVWDSYQKDLLRRSIGETTNVQVVGTIWFNTSSVELPDVPERSIAVFDIQPIRSSAHFGLSTMNDYDFCNPNVPMQFIKDIYAAVVTQGSVVVHKRKRNDPRFRKCYRRMLQVLDGSSGFLSVEPDTSAIRVIEHCRGAISLPFTSTGVIGHYMGKPSAFYDPTGLLQKDDLGAHGVPILSGKDELQRWVRRVLSPSSHSDRSDECVRSAMSG